MSRRRHLNCGCSSHIERPRSPGSFTRPHRRLSCRQFNVMPRTTFTVCPQLWIDFCSGLLAPLALLAPEAGSLWSYLGPPTSKETPHCGLPGHIQTLPWPGVLTRAHRRLSRCGQFTVLPRTVFLGRVQLVGPRGVRPWSSKLLNDPKLLNDSTREHPPHI